MQKGMKSVSAILYILFPLGQFATSWTSVTTIKKSSVSNYRIPNIP